MAGKWLPVANLTSSKRPILTGDEVECFYLSSIDIEPDFTTHPTLSPYTSGILTLTTHRLIWISPSSDTASISLSQITHIHPPKKSLKSMLSISSPRVKFDLSHPSMGSIAVTLVMRGKSDNHDLFFEKFWAAWKGRAWEISGAVAAAEAGAGAGEGSSVAIRVPVVGVAGILRKEQEMWESTDKTLQDAFQDLNALMSKAREMVKLAERMRQKLLAGPTSQSSNASDEDMSSKEDVQELLLSVGIISPVTKESAGALYHQQLSRQLADFARVPLERAGGMINLIDVYCLFNRARGTELISPDDLLQACTLWEKLDVPIMLRKFDSGVMVIQSKSQSDDEVFGRIRTLVLKPEALRVGISASDAAMTLEIAPAMAKEHLLAAESKGLLCRDTSPDGFRFFVNLFPEINLDDMYLVNESGIYASWVAAVGGIVVRWLEHSNVKSSLQSSLNNLCNA